MKKILKSGSLLGLMLTIYPPVMFYMGDVNLDRMKWAMGIGMLLWFVTAPFWINKSVNNEQ
jgi:hypothetical protein